LADPELLYRIAPSDPHGHLFEVTLTIAHPAPAGQVLSLPAWIPGSYMIREFARHLVSIEARAGRSNRRVTLEKLDKHTWRAGRVAAGPLVVRYQVYAWDLSVRAAHLDATHGFFNGTSVFLRVQGQEEVPCHVDIEPPPASVADGWQVATTLPEAGARRHGFGRYRADDYDALIDHPVEMGRFRLARFEAAGAQHEIAVTGRTDVDLDRLSADLAPVCAAQAALFEPRTRRAPFDRYLFLTMSVGEGYGGLEHRDSTALLCSRNDLPYPGMTGLPDGYRGFLGLASHEYFHAWHVKRIRPARFLPYDLARENYTRLLWIFEGFTSYYDDLMLVRAGVLPEADYLKALGRTISGVLRAPGRLRQSVAESSFDAWAKYYRQDENSPNAIVSYYTKGSLVALALDLEIRRKSRGTRSLDDVMRKLWRDHGRDGLAASASGLAEEAVAEVFGAATGVDLSVQIEAWAHGAADLPLDALLKPFGVRWSVAAADASPTLGVRTTVRGSDLAIATAYTSGAAHRAGLSAGDVIVAVDGLKVDEKSLKALLARRRPGDRITVHAFRRDELMTHEVVLQAPDPVEVTLSLDPKPNPLRRGWLGRSGGGRRGRANG
jgi:predicted metalloprotease with PDZ domain